ncbi:MAG: GNAT family N-acetyltransferase [Candidatus Dormiibacterota bacterium]
MVRPAALHGADPIALPPARPLEAGDDVAAFSSGQPVLDAWLRSTASTAQAAGTAAVYVSVLDDQVVGFYALAMHAVGVAPAPKRLGRGMLDPRPVILLARLAIDQAWQGAGNGGHLLAEALRRCVVGAHCYGARAVVVDAIDERPAAFYRHFGFRELEGNRRWLKVSDFGG